MRWLDLRCTGTVRPFSFHHLVLKVVGIWPWQMQMSLCLQNVQRFTCRDSPRAKATR